MSKKNIKIVLMSIGLALDILVFIRALKSQA